MRRSRLIGLVVTLSLLVGMVSVASPTETEAAKIKVTSVKVNAPYGKTVTMAKGKKITLTADVTVTPNKKAYKKVSFTSKNKKIATVTQKGVVKAKKVGTTKIVIAAKKNKKKKAVVKLKVVKNPVQSVTLSQSTVAMKAGETTALKATVTAKSGASKKLYWTSSDTTVATVTQTGVLVAMKVGTATITARAIDGSNKKATCQVTVTAVSSGVPEEAGTTVLPTAEPMETPIPTALPEETDTPSVTLSPESTEEPTEMIMPTAAPETTKQPEVTEAPSETTRPETTSEPVVSATPEPAVSATPVPVMTATPEPAVSATPVPVMTATPEPAVSATPVPVMTATPEPVASATPIPTPEADTTVSIASAEVLSSAVVTFTLNRPFEIQEEDITLERKRVLSGTYQYAFTIDDMSTTDNQTYRLVVAQGEDFVTGDILRISIPTLTGAVKQKEFVWREPTSEFFEQERLLGTVGEEFDEIIHANSNWSDYYGDPDYIVGSISFEITDLPAGLTCKQYWGYDSAVQITGTPKKAGVYRSVLTAVDEAGNTFVKEIHFAIGDTSTLAAVTQDTYVAKWSVNSSVTAYGYFDVTGGSGNYTFQIEENSYNAVIPSSNSNATHGVTAHFSQAGDYEVDVTIKDASDSTLTTTVTMVYHVLPTQTFSGKVLDATGVGLSGVKVTFHDVNKGTQIATRYATTGSAGTYSQLVPEGTYNIEFCHKLTGARTYLLGKKLEGGDVVLPDVSLNVYPVTIALADGYVLNGKASWYDEYGAVVGTGSKIWLKNGSYSIYSDPYVDDFLTDSYRKKAKITVVNGEATTEISYEKLTREITAMTSNTLTLNFGLEKVRYVSFTPTQTGTYVINGGTNGTYTQRVSVYDSAGKVLLNDRALAGGPTVTLTAGQTYYFACFHSSSSSTGTITLCVNLKE